MLYMLQAQSESYVGIFRRSRQQELTFLHLSRPYSGNGRTGRTVPHNGGFNVLSGRRYQRITMANLHISNIENKTSNQQEFQNIETSKNQLCRGLPSDPYATTCKERPVGVKGVGYRTGPGHQGVCWTKLWKGVVSNVQDSAFKVSCRSATRFTLCLPFKKGRCAFNDRVGMSGDAFSHGYQTICATGM